MRSLGRQQQAKAAFRVRHGHAVFPFQKNGYASKGLVGGCVAHQSAQALVGRVSWVSFLGWVQRTGRGRCPRTGGFGGAGS